MRKITILGSFFVLSTGFFILMGCANPKIPQAEIPFSSADSPGKTIEKPVLSGWETEWGKTVEAARKEGKVSAYSTVSAEVRTAISEAFKARYGIEVEWVAGKSGELAEKLFRERRSGIYWADMATGGTGTALNVLKPAGVLDYIEPELILPDVTDPAAWYQGKLPFFDRDKVIFSFRADINNTILIHKSSAKKEEIESYKDLLNPKWRKRIAWYDPTIGGSGNQFFSVVGEIIMGYDFMKELARQEPLFSRDKRQLVEWIARGKHAIGLGAEDASVQEFLRAGVPLEEFTPKEGSYMTSGSGNIHLYNKPSHPKARKVFLNWLLSHEGQTIWSKVGGTQSARVDVSTQHLPAGRIREPGKKYFMADTEEWEAQKEKRFDLAQQIFGALLK